MGGVKGTRVGGRTCLHPAIHIYGSRQGPAIYMYIYGPTWIQPIAKGSSSAHALTKSSAPSGLSL